MDQPKQLAAAVALGILGTLLVVAYVVNAPAEFLSLIRSALLTTVVVIAVHLSGTRVLRATVSAVERAYEKGYVDGVSRRAPDQRQLHSIN